LKTGAGPRRSSKKLDALLASRRPDRILLIGYAGALAPELKIGDLVVLQEASIFGEHNANRQPLDQVEITEGYDLKYSSELFNLIQRAGIRAHCGKGLTSPFILGNPDQKRILYRRFEALTIDMETAAMARVARAAGGVPLACVRAISDEVDDEVLAPFSYDPGTSKWCRATRVLGAGNWRDRFKSWREHAGKARVSLEGFLQICFETWATGDPDSSWLSSKQPPRHQDTSS